MSRPLSRPRRVALHAVILGASLLQAAAFVSRGELHFFSDSAVRWRQAVDLASTGLRTECRYPAQQLVPGSESRYFPSGYVSFRNGRCFYWFSPYAARVFAVVVALGGKPGIIVLQQLALIAVSYWLYLTGLRLGLSFGLVLMGLVLFRFGSAAVIVGGDIEPHGLVALLFALACVLVAGGHPSIGRLQDAPPRRAALAAAGLCGGLAFALRPEAGALAIFLPLAVFASTEGSVRRRAVRGLWVLAVALLVVALVAYNNHREYGHLLGVKMLDPLNRFSGTWWERLVNLRRVLFLAPRLPTNPLFFQMPLLLLLGPAAWRFVRRPESFGRLERLLLCLALALVPLALATPLHLGGPYLGFRFGLFLYPACILLALAELQRWLQRNNEASPVSRLSAARSDPGRSHSEWLSGARLRTVGWSIAWLTVLWSVVLAVAILWIGNRVYSDYRRAHAGVLRAEAAVVILRDPYSYSVLNGDFYRRSYLYAAESAEVVRLLAQLADRNVRTLSVVRHGAPALTREELRGIKRDWLPRRAAVSSGSIQIVELRRTGP